MNEQPDPAGGRVQSGQKSLPGSVSAKFFNTSNMIAFIYMYISKCLSLFESLIYLFKDIFISTCI